MILNTNTRKGEYDFDVNNNVSKFTALTPSGSNKTTYTYGKDNLLAKATFNSGKSLTNTFDNLGRLTNTSLNTTSAINTAYSYLASNKSGYTTSLVEKEENGDFAYKYEYDANGNITRISKKNGSTYTAFEEYAYDSTGQLTQVDYLDLNKRCVYTYDRAGNIMKEKIYTLTDSGATLVNSKNYTYGDINWRDKLTKYGSSTITYDEIGNPLNYRDGISFTWSNGRQLKTYSKDDTNISFTYDSSGMRLSKNVNGEQHTYLYNSGLLVQETIGGKILDYSYDAHGTVYMLKYRTSASDTGTYYYYAHNTRGDVIGLYDANGNLYAKYSYDVWGNSIAVTNASGIEITDTTDIANIQPLRYRGYYYDTETGFYYLQSRYYDPITHRFINTDGLVSTGTGVLGHNMFTYCDNNPVNRIDSNGQFWKQLNTWIKKTVKKVKQWAAKAYRTCCSWASSFFGASASTTSTITKSESYIIPDPSPITFKTGNKVTRTTYSTGDSSKPVSVYAVGSLDDQVFSSSAGLKLNYPNLTVKFNLAGDNIGIYGSVSKNNVTDSFGLRVNITQLKIGINSSSSVTHDNDTFTDYWDFDVSGLMIAYAYLLLNGEAPEASYAYSY